MKNEILVAGDVVLDRHIYEGRRREYSDASSRGVHVEEEVGGAALVHGLLEKLFQVVPGWCSRLTVEIPTGDDDDAKAAKKALFAKVDDSQKAYAIWRPFAKKKATDDEVWRVHDALGFGGTPRTSETPFIWPAAKLPSELPRIIVVSDGGMGYRGEDEDANHPWSDLAAAFKNAAWIILKTTAPLMEGPLWKELAGKYHDKLIVITSAWAVRQTNARLCEGLSWDETIESFLRELQRQGALHKLASCRHLIVAFDSEGILWVDRREGKPDEFCVHAAYAAGAIEGDHARDVEGKTFGPLSCLTAAVAFTVAKKTGLTSAQQIDLKAALEGGLAAMRNLRDEGHGSIHARAHGYPFKRLADVIHVPKFGCSFARFTFPAGDEPDSKRPVWSVVRESQPPNLETVQPGQATAFYKLARLCVLRGPIALQSLPHLKIEGLWAIDRQEVESLRTLVKIIQRYQDADAGSKPLSIGVFGPPGAGKSFAVKELAKKYCKKDGWMEFNLSQFAAPTDLIGAFHQIRDMVLKFLPPSPVLPTAFFDEFDVQKYYWLRYLLAPMQDGQFQDGQVKHPIGKCLFIFAGGTSATFESFGPKKRESETPEYADFKLAKGPDFKSRLDGYYDVVGPNRRQVAKECTSTGPPTTDFVDDDNDVYFPLRRALMIRGELKCPEAEKIQMDKGVLNALLKVKRLEHGSRSLTKLLQPFAAVCAQARAHSTRSPRLVRSLLPPLSQIEMHVNTREFLELLDEPGGSPATIDNGLLAYSVESCSGALRLPNEGAIAESDVRLIAQAIHKTYENTVKAADPAHTEVAFDALTEFKKKSNDAAVRRMVRILDLLALNVIVGDATQEEEAEVRKYLEYHLEMLAEAEHDGWMHWHWRQDWHYGKTRDDAKRVHPLLIPYAKLDHLEQNKDRATIGQYPEYVKIVKKDGQSRMIWFRGRGRLRPAQAATSPAAAPDSIDKSP